MRGIILSVYFQLYPEQGGFLANVEPVPARINVLQPLPRIGNAYTFAAACRAVIKYGVLGGEQYFVVGYF